MADYFAKFPTVGELVEALRKMPQNAKVFYYYDGRECPAEVKYLYFDGNTGRVEL